MEIQTEILDRHVEAAAIEQLAAQLRSDGYDIATERVLAKTRFDLVAEKNGEKTAYGVKVFRTGSRTARKSITSMQRTARELGIGFKLVIVRPPKYTHIIFDGLERKLLDWFTERVPTEIDTIGHHSTVDDVYDLEIECAEIGETSIDISGTGSVGATIHSGEGPVSDEIFPFRFDLKLDASDQSIAELECDVDTSIWYGEAAE